MKTPDQQDARLCMEYRLRSKIGGHLSREELKHCEKMLKKFPEWYRNGNGEIFNEAAKAVGSDAKYKGVG